MWCQLCEGGSPMVKPPSLISANAIVSSYEQCVRGCIHFCSWQLTQQQILWNTLCVCIFMSCTSFCLGLTSKYRNSKTLGLRGIENGGEVRSLRLHHAYLLKWKVSGLDFFVWVHKESVCVSAFSCISNPFLLGILFGAIQLFDFFFFFFVKAGKYVFIGFFGGVGVSFFVLKKIYLLWCHCNLLCLGT